MPAALIIGNSDGIGLALTQLLLGEGWRVVGISRSPSSVGSRGYEHHVCDVCGDEYAARLSAVVEQLSAPWVCVYCVGIGEFLDVESMAAERRIFETNLLGAVATVQIVIPAMVRARSGHFIGLSSQADVIIDGRAPSYAASKAGMSSYLEALALACRPRGVFITNVRFGFVDTKLAKSPVRPFMVSPRVAAQHIQRCIERRPIRYTFPWRLAALVWVFRAGSSLRRWFVSTRPTRSRRSTVR